MPLLVDSQPIILAPGAATRYVTPKLAIDPQSAGFTLQLRFPTTLSSILWDSTGVVRVSLVLTVDGVEHRYRGGKMRGGVHPHWRTGVEHTHYTLRFEPTCGYFGAREGFMKRLGETSKSEYTAHVEVELIEGSVTTELTVDTVIAEAPQIAFHSSIAVDAKSSGQEQPASGDTLTVSHTASGSDRAAWACAGGSHDPAPTGSSTTYAGTAMNEKGDVASPAFGRMAGYSLPAIPTGAQSVVNTMTGVAGGEQALIVISLTGVNQASEAGTGATGSGSATPASATVGSVGATDFVLDGVYQDFNGTLTAGADQTEERRETIAAFSLALLCSSQLGSAGGAMTWTLGGTSANGVGWASVAVAFVAATIPAGSVVGSGGGGFAAWGETPWAAVPADAAGGGSVAVGLASETDTAFAVTRTKVRAVGLSSETDTAFAITVQKSRAVGLASEADSAFAIARTKLKAVGLSAEADTGFAVNRVKARTVGLSQEADSAFSIARAKQRAVGLAAEMETAFGITRTKSLFLGLAAEMETAFSITRAKNLFLGLAVELDLAFATQVVKPINLPDHHIFDVPDSEDETIARAGARSEFELAGGRTFIVPTADRTED